MGSALQHLSRVPRGSDMSHADKRIAACFDCGLSYGDDGWADFIVLDEVWLQISPTNSKDGLLCVTCMTRRMVKLGLHAFGRFSSGPFSIQPAPSVAA